GPGGSCGGKRDYSGIGEGPRLYLPVYHSGGLIFIGDGHALQGDGEAVGSGIEVSMDVEFSAEIKKNAHLTGPRLETDDLIVAIGSQPESSSLLDNGLKLATTDMVEWLTKEYGMEPVHAHLLIGFQGRYDIVPFAGSVAMVLEKNRLQKK